MTVERAQPAHRRRLRLAGGAAVHAVAARARRAGARRRAVPRRGGAGARSAALAHRRARRWRRDAAAGRPCHLHVGGARCSRSTTASAWSACLRCSTGSARRSTWAARRVPRPRRPELALAIGNLGAPGGLTRSVVLSLGAGLSLLVTVALVDRSIVARADRAGCPRRAPTTSCSTSSATESDDFRGAGHARGRRPPRCSEAPMLRGRLVKLGDRPVEQVKAPPEAQWVLTGDRGLSYAATVPEGSTVVAGHMVAGGLCGRAARFLRGRHRQGARPEDRRHRHRQCARPQRHGAHRQSARGEVGEPVAQLRPGVLAQYAGRRAAQPAGDRDAAEGRAAGRRSQACAASWAAHFRPPRPFASRTPSTRSMPSSTASWWPCGRPAA